jgi:peptidoglycan/xylan/chitin deacetylase (PgdA/CDA1 family)
MATKEFFKKNKKLVIAVTGIVVTLLFLIILFLSLFNININLNGSPKETIEYGDTYTEQGATAAFNTPASKNVPLNVTIKGSVDSSKLGTYHIHYKAKKGIFSVQKSREVKIVDTKAPIIELNKIDGYYPKTGETYQEEGFTATDNYDGDITSKIKRTEDKNVITYTVSDSSGNKTSVQRTIEYNDGIAPTITLNGDSDITIKAGTRFEDPGCTAKDSHGNDISDSVSVSDNISTYRAGTYTITYSVTDKFGNETSIDRTVTVEAVKQTATTSSGNKVVYLTFDDGPGAHTQQLLDILDKYNVKVTFFVTNVNSGYENMIAKEAAAGHTVAIHSASHDYKKIYSSVDAYFADLNEMSDIIYAQTGQRAKLIRFPGGSSNTVSLKYCSGIMTTLTKAVTDQGYKYFDWNVSSGDAGGTTSTEEVYQNVVNGMKSHNVSVVLQHDIKGFSVNAVERIIQWGLANGYTFLPLTTSTEDVHHGVNN